MNNAARKLADIAQGSAFEAAHVHAAAVVAALYATREATAQKPSRRQRLIDTQHRAEVKVLMPLQRAVLKAALKAMHKTQRLLYRGAIQRCLSHVDDMEAWAEGGTVPESAKRFACLFELGMNQCCKCKGDVGCPVCIAGADLCQEFNCIAPIEPLWSALGWAARVDEFDDHTFKEAINSLGRGIPGMEAGMGGGIDVDDVCDAFEDALDDIAK